MGKGPESETRKEDGGKWSKEKRENRASKRGGLKREIGTNQEGENRSGGGAGTRVGMERGRETGWKGQSRERREEGSGREGHA